MHRRKQHGFTMVELLVALLIGLFLLGGMGMMVFDNKRAFVGQNAMAQLQDDERLAMTMMTDIIQTTGYYPNPRLNTAQTMFASEATTTPVLATAQTIAGTTGATLQGDTITVRYASGPNDGVLNCSGAANAGATTWFANTFAVVLNASNVPQLVCTVTTANGSTPYVLVNNVYSLNILYGVNSAGITNNVDSYMTAAQVTANNDWNNVVSVQVSITFLNPLAAANGNHVAGQGTQAQGAQPGTLPAFTRTIGLMAKTGIS